MREATSSTGSVIYDYELVALTDGLGRVTRTVSAEGFATTYQYENRAAGAADPVLGVADRNIGGIRRTTIVSVAPRPS